MFKISSVFFAVVLAFVAYSFNLPMALGVAESVSAIFVNLLKLVSLPIIFLSITSTFSGLKAFSYAKQMLSKILFYTLLTTTIAALVALTLYLCLAPSRGVVLSSAAETVNNGDWSYGSFLLSIFPDNFVKIFLDNNVMGCVFVAFLLGMGSLFIDSEKRAALNRFLVVFFELFLQMASFTVKLMPIAVWAFVTTFLYMPKGEYFSQGIMKYLFCIVLANVIQATVVLPVFIKANGLSVIRTLRGVLPALLTAFFARSSTASLPVTLSCITNNLGISKKLASFVLPLCTNINMNACASFILITVLFVCEVNAHVFSTGEMLVWVLLAIGAAIGNAGVPMGCYFMTMNYLISLKMPLHVMGLILPIYTLIDMFETALNVWSDVCITAVMARDSGKYEEAWKEDN